MTMTRSARALLEYQTRAPSPVDARRREIATLRAIGFGATPVVVSVLLEGMLLAIVASIVGVWVAWAFFNGKTVTTQSLTFPLAVNARLIAISILWALAIGFLGGLLPALRAARLPVASALRAV
jgi:putative ABC transport system permease protein